MSGRPDDPFFPSTELLQPTSLPIPIVWAAHTGSETELLLEELETWVTWLISRFHVDHRLVPSCWQAHTEVLEELSALHLAWQGAYATTAAPDSPLRWMEQFASARARLGEWVSRTGCRPGEHRPPKVVPAPTASSRLPS